MSLLRRGVTLLLCLLPLCAEAQKIDEQKRAQLDAEAERIMQRIEAEGNTPAGLHIRTSYVTARTSNAHAAYIKSMAANVEVVGNAHFPSQNGKKLYGKLIVAIPVSSDGRIFETNGGPTVNRSSGIVELDTAALAIIRSAAPFPPIPANMRNPGVEDVWVIITTFNFDHREEEAPAKASAE